jgi:hypothetical protein
MHNGSLSALPDYPMSTSGAQSLFDVVLRVPCQLNRGGYRAIGSTCASFHVLASVS